MLQQPLRGEIFKVFGKGWETYMGWISIFGGRDNSLETMRWIHTLLKGSIRKIYKKSFANNNNDSKINEMLHSVKLEY